GPQDLDIDSFVTRYDDLGVFEHYDNDNRRQPIRCVRPYEMQVQTPGGAVRDSSNAYLKWHTQVGPDTEGLAVDLPQPSRWERIVVGICFFTHHHHTPLEIRRFATHSDATITLETGQQIDTRVRFVEHSNPDEQAAQPLSLGFAMN